VHSFNLSVGRTPQTDSPKVPPRPSKQSRASSDSVPVQISTVRKELEEFVDAINRSNDASLSYFRGKYHDQVWYFGKLISKQSVLNERQAFLEKWPARNYSVQPGSIAVSCKTSSECMAEGILNWQISGPLLKTKGRATLLLIWVLDDGIWKITSENTQPLQRKDAHTPLLPVR
jgi:hypothetical protein